MKKIIEYFVKNSFLVNLVSFLVLVAGIFSITSMNRDLVPPFEWNQVRVNISLFGATPKEVEKYVTSPIEDALKGLRGVEKITSTSKSGQSQIKIYYKSSFEHMIEAPEIVRSKIQAIRSQLPDNLRSIQVTRSRTNDLFLYWLGVENYDEANEIHRQFLITVKRTFLDIPGVVHVGSWDRNRDLYIEFKPHKLKQYEITVRQATSIVKQSLNFAPIGEARIQENKFSVEIAKVADSLKQIKEIPIAGNRSGHSIQLKDIATVHFKLSKESSLKFINGSQGITLNLRKDLTTDTVDLKEKVLTAMGKLNKQAPDKVKIISLVDGAHFVERQLSVLVKNGLVGALLVVLVLMLFLNWRTAAMTALGLPIAYFGTLIVLYALGMNFDLITLIGLILVIGILVDDAIIVSEKYIEYLEQGFPPKKAAVSAVTDLIIPVTGTILTTLVAFSPLILIKSELGTILAAVPIIVITSLLLSWIESFYILPNHLGHFVKKAPKEKVSLFAKVKSGYERLLSFTLRFRYLALISIILLFGLSIYIATAKLKHDFNLRVNSERLSVYVMLKESKALEETRSKIKPIEDYLRSLPKDKIENYFTSIGWVWINGKVHDGFRYAKINAYLYRDEKHPNQLKKSMKVEIDKFLKSIKDDSFVSLYTEIERGDNNEEKNNMISVRVKGSDELDYIDIENSIVTASKKVPAIKEFVRQPDLYQKTWEFTPDHSKMVQYKMNTLQLSDAMKGFFRRNEIALARMNGEEIRIYTEIEKSSDPKFDELDQLEVITPLGVNVPLKFLGQWQAKESLKEIKHYDGQRNLTLDFKLSDKDTNSHQAKEQLRQALLPVKKLLPGYSVEVIDTNEEEAKNRAWAFKVAILCILGVLFVIALTLKSLTQPILVGLPIPFGLIGIFIALYLHDLPLGVMALIGLVGVIGVSVNASIVMVDQINKKVRATGGVLTREILIQGASSRLRAILLTTFTTLGGVFPMAYSIGGESGFTQPLAFSMGWGITASTLLTLFILPAMILIREDILKLIYRKRSTLENSKIEFSEPDLNIEESGNYQEEKWDKPSSNSVNPPWH